MAVAVEPHVSDWAHKTHENLTGKRKQAEVRMARRQIPLAPEGVRTVQTAQGMSMDAAAIYMAKPGSTMDMDDYWMHLYVMISRVRQSGGLLAFDVPDYKIFERGPPPWVVRGTAELEALCRQSRNFVAQARAKLGWQAAEVGAGDEVDADMGVGAFAPAEVRPELDESFHVQQGCPLSQRLSSRSGALSMPLVSVARAAAQIGSGSDAGLGVGYRSWGEPERCRRVHVRSGLDVLQPVAAQSLTLLCGDVDVPGVMRGLPGLAADLGGGFANSENSGACFVNAALQSFLRIDVVHRLLQGHKSVHASDGLFCVACALADTSEVLRSGQPGDSLSVLAQVQAGTFAGLRKKPAKGPAAATAVAGDACSFLLGCAGTDGVPTQKGLVDVLHGLETLPSSSRKGGSAPPRQVSAFRDLVFGGIVQRRQYCRACQKAEDTLQPCCALQLSCPSGHKTVRLEDMLQTWVADPTKEKCQGASGCGSQCSASFFLSGSRRSWFFSHCAVGPGKSPDALLRSHQRFDA